VPVEKVHYFTNYRKGDELTAVIIGEYHGCELHIEFYLIQPIHR
jgi:hypothetical protein